MQDGIHSINIRKVMIDTDKRCNGLFFNLNGAPYYSYIYKYFIILAVFYYYFFTNSLNARDYAKCLISNIMVSIFFPILLFPGFPDLILKFIHIIK